MAERFNGELGLGYFTAFDNVVIAADEPDRDLALEKNVHIAAEVGYKFLEVGAAIPNPNTRDPTVDTLSLVDIVMDDTRVGKINGWLSGSGIAISSLGYYDNMMDGDSEVRTRNQTHLKKVIDAAADLGVKYVGTFAGRDMNLGIRENMELFKEVFVNLVGYAKEKGVKLMFENCPMEGLTTPETQIHSISYCPAIWNEMFDIMKDAGLDGWLGLNFDPSHLTWQDIDPIQAVYDLEKAGHADNIFHVHAKDILRDITKLQAHGIYGDQLSGATWNQAYDHRVPGTVSYLSDSERVGTGIPNAVELSRSVYWRGFVSALRDVGYSGVLSFEHEDHRFKGNPAEDLPGANAVRKEALSIARSYLAQVIADTATTRYVVDRAVGNVTLEKVA